MVPFVCKVIETSRHSTIFKLPDPWVNAIIRLLAEINNKENLKLGLRFEIEVLCKALTLDLSEIKPTDLLKFHKQYTGPNNFDFNPPPTPPPSEEPPFNQLASYLVIQPHIPLFSQKPQLARFIPIAIDKAIKEIITPVVERSVNIASITTREIATKDFATEPDENKMRNAAQLMVQNLAGSLAMVTCKEPLRVAIANNLRSVFTAQIGESPNIEFAVQAITNDNLDLASSLIEKAATEKAIKETTEHLAAAFLQRKSHRESRQNKVFFDINVKFPSALPEFLRPQVGGLTPNQLHVYEDFGLSLQKDTLSPEDKEIAAPPIKTPAREETGLTLQHVIERFGVIFQKIDTAIHPLLKHNLTMSQLPQDHEIFKLIKSIPAIISQCSERNAPAQFAANIIRRLFRHELPPIYLEIQLVILEAIIDLDKKLLKDIVNWLAVNFSLNTFNWILAKIHRY